MFLIKLCEKLNSEKISYAITGGWAVALHKIPRTTFDVDVVIRLSSNNLEKIEQALKDLNLVSRLPLDSQSIFKFREEYINNKNLIAWSFHNPIRPSDIVDIIITDDLNEYDYEYIDVAKTRIPILTIKSLIKSKEKSKRPQDLEDIKWLKKMISTK